MSKYHPIRFGVINEHMTTREAWVAGALRAEALGYATFLIRDHFVPDFFGDQFAPFAALMAAAMATTTLRIGTLVIDNDYRHPVILAKEADARPALWRPLRTGAGRGLAAHRVRQGGDAL